MKVLLKVGLDPIVGNFFEDAFAEPLGAAGEWATATTPVEIARIIVVGQRPHDHAVKPVVIKPITTGLEKMLAKAHALIVWIEVQLVNLAAVRFWTARFAAGCVTDNRAGNFKHQEMAFGADRVSPPSIVAPRYQSREMQRRNNAGVGELPRLSKDLRQSTGIRGCCFTYRNCCPALNHG